MKTLNTCLGFFMLITFLSGCGMSHVKNLLENEPLPNTAPVGDKQELLQNTAPGGDKQDPPKEDFIPGFHPFNDDPDNPSPHNPLVRKFGDIPEVRTYIRHQQKLRCGHGLNIDEAIELYTAEAYLYPTDAAKANLKAWKNDKARYIRLGIPVGEPVLTYTGGVSHDSVRGDSVINPLTDDPDNPSPHNPLIKKFGDIPEVRTYIRLKQKLGRGIGLNIDEAIELYTAEVYLYPTPDAKEMLKDLKADKKRYKRLGIPEDEPVFSDIIDPIVDPSAEEQTDTKAAD